MRRARDERGFTLIELMIVVLIIGVLIAIALPTFLGTRTRAQDRSTQAGIRNTFVAEKTYYADTQAYTETVGQITAIEPSLSMLVTGDTPAAVGSIYVHYHPAQVQVFVSAKSPSGTCFYLTDVNGAGTIYAKSIGCGIADTQSYTGTW